MMPVPPLPGDTLHVWHSAAWRLWLQARFVPRAPCWKNGPKRSASPGNARKRLRHTPPGGKARMEIENLQKPGGSCEGGSRQRRGRDLAFRTAGVASCGYPARNGFPGGDRQGLASDPYGKFPDPGQTKRLLLEPLREDCRCRRRGSDPECRYPHGCAGEGAMFAGAKMPYWMRLTDTGVGMHVGYVPGHPASHGCIRLNREVAQKLFALVKVGTPVVVAERAPALEAVSPKTH